MLRYYLNLYPAFLRIAVLAQIQYRASGVIWMIGSIIEPVIFLVVWSRVARARGGEVGGYAENEFAAYYIVLMLVNHVTFTWIMHVFQSRIQFGQLSFQLMRPVHPIHEDLSDNVAYKIVQLTVMLPAVIILILIFQPKFNFEMWSLLLAVPAIILALAVRFTLEWTLALVAFWTTRVNAINQSYFAIIMFFSGRVAPMALLPVTIQSIASALPFYYMIAFPGGLLLGKLTPAQALTNIVIQLGWLAFALMLLVSLWKVAVKQYSAVGN